MYVGCGSNNFIDLAKNKRFGVIHYSILSEKQYANGRLMRMVSTSHKTVCNFS